jgi:NADPH:quinone reductase-like Zn-dependent oxidoreductase
LCSKARPTYLTPDVNYECVSRRGNQLNDPCEKLLAAASEVFELIGQGVLKVAVNQRFALADARTAHEALESRG